MITSSLKMARRADTRELLPLDEYDHILVSFSGGKDSLAVLLDLLDRGEDRSRVQLWHQDVDGEEDSSSSFMDWPCTRAYVRAVGEALDVPVFFQQRLGGFLGEMLKENARPRPVRFQTQQGQWALAGGTDACKISTRLKFPQPTANLAVRWCSAVLKIDAFALAINNEPLFQKKGKRLLVLTGERREESANRAGYAEREPHRCDARKRRVDAWRPVIDWEERAVWDIIRRHRIRPHPAYYLGFPRVSCLACIFGQADQWASVRAIAPDVFERIARYEEEFNCTIKKGVSVRGLADKGTPYPQTKDRDLVALAMGKDYPAGRIIVGEEEEEEAWELPAGAYKTGGGGPS